VKIILEKFEEKFEAETSLLFEDAIEKIEKVDIQANESKKQIIINLAKSLEGKIPTDTISMEIVKQLYGRVSKRFIHQCLDIKYKQKVRVYNARKQRHLKYKVIGKLGVVTPLKQAVEEEEEDVIVDASDKISIEDAGRDEPSTTADFSVMTDKTIASVSNQQEHGLNEKTDHSLEEYSSYQELRNETREVALEKASQFVTADKMVITEVSANTHDNEMDKSILHFEFPMHYKDLQNHMDLLFKSSSNDEEVWFNGKIDKKTEKVISSNFGRMN
jgi:hypothetical protein